MTHSFIDRPIFATVLSVFVTLIGLGALALLPIAQYPEIVPLTVQITTTYPGAQGDTSPPIHVDIARNPNATVGIRRFITLLPTCWRFCRFKHVPYPKETNGSSNEPCSSAAALLRYAGMAW